MSVFTSIISEILNMFKEFSWQNLLDILIVAFIIYKAIQLLRETKAGQLIKSIIILVAVYLLSLWLDLFMLRSILQYVFQAGLIAIVIVFQPELRRTLEKLGRSSLNPFSRMTKVEEEEEVKACIDAVLRACKSMQDSKTGALIVFERSTLLGDVIGSGTVISARASADLIQNIFFPNSPLHDGAMIIRGARIYAAGCILPLTSNPDISRELGTRHRAAIGVTEESDATVVIVSEETGVISVARGGGITRNHTMITLRAILERELLASYGEQGRRGMVKRTFENLKRFVAPQKKSKIVYEDTAGGDTPSDGSGADSAGSKGDDGNA